MSAGPQTPNRPAIPRDAAESNPEKLAHTAVLPNGEIVEDGQYFDWGRTTCEIRINCGRIRFIRDPDATGDIWGGGPEMVTWVQPDSEEEFHEFLAEHGDDIVFHERPSQQTGLLDALRNVLPL